MHMYVEVVRRWRKSWVINSMTIGTFKVNIH